eukprot:TRINITY_DN12246_c0_g1_i1.p1 TRINITY_DN12246_c0_g1~~TRINITY_DN12246_c0_g1_i1.p1  ORF type:complete len:543 (+),score=98.80 TRINITY_DN12246_c0_g1_i1:51-1679(+)
MQDFFDHDQGATHTGGRSVLSRKGMVATSHHLASQAGLEILQKGGNAFDAAIATAAALTVLEPTGNGLGSDAFAILWPASSTKPVAINSSGPSPASISIESVKKRGHHETMPHLGVLPITVPGAPAAWAEITRKYGKLTLLQNLEAAIRYAEQGYAVTPRIASDWESYFNVLKPFEKRPEHQGWFQTFAPNGVPPKTGETFRSGDHAETLREIGRTDAESFYRGELAEKISRFVQQNNGHLSSQDLANYRPEWVDPISVSYRGYDVWELPPNGQGLVALLALSICNGYQIKNDVASLHTQIEAMKLALTDGKAYITDPSFMDPTIRSHLLSPEYAQERRKEINPAAANPSPSAYLPQKSGTVYLAAADEEGNLISYIQSNYEGFGSGVVVPGTGIALQNRGHDFRLDPNHPNALAPKKRSYHTIIPGFLSHNGRPLGPFGVMGGYMQPQGHLQVITQTIDGRLSPQAALEVARWRWSLDGRTIFVEEGFAKEKIEELRGLGHEVIVSKSNRGFGLGQIIWRTHNGLLVGGSDSRADGSVAAW